MVFVVDSQRERVDANIASFEELRQALRAYGRQIEDVPLLVQYNKRDLADPYALEELHRKLDVKGAIVFEAVATDGTGVLQTLSTISKRVIRSLREQGVGAGPAPAEPLAPPAPAPALRAPAAPPRAVRGQRVRAHGARDPRGSAPSRARRDRRRRAARPRRCSTAPPGSRPRRASEPRERPAACTSRASDPPPRPRDGGVRIELVIADEEGRRSSAVLTLRLEGVDEEPSR